MFIFENLEEIFQDWRSFNDYTKSIVTLATAVGTIVILFYTLKLLYKAFLGFRLYIWSQICNRTNFVEKYGKWAVISGSTDGIGQAMAVEFAKKGHSILVIGRNEEKLAKTKEILEKIENVGEVETVKIDLSDSSIANYSRIRSQIDPDNRDIGILINNAGFFQSKFRRFNANPTEDLLNIINVNILATIHLTRMIMPGMLNRQRGLVVNVSSIMGNQTLPYTNLYAQTKVFINDFTRSLQIEYSNHPIDIICLTPGPVYTKLFKETGTLKKPSCLAPTSEEFAQSSINCFSTGIGKISGTAMHGWFSSFGSPPTIDFTLNLTYRIASFIYPKTIILSPVMKRKKPPTVNAQAGEQENVFNATVET